MKHAGESSGDDDPLRVDHMPSEGGQIHTNVRAQMDHVREALRLRRLARGQMRLYDLYIEHNLFEEAVLVRRSMLAVLRRARGHWRRTLGISAQVGHELDRERADREA